MVIAGLSPEAHGTLMALQGLREIRVHDEAVAQELVRHGYAEIVDGKLQVTDEGIGARLFEEESLHS